MNQRVSLDAAKLDKGMKSLRTPFALAAFQGAKMPLGLAAGLRLDAVDRASCTISLPGGWRTQNPFGSMYWAAQGMAAEMATGIHGVVAVRAAPVPVRMILAGCEGTFSRQCKGRARFVFSGGETVFEVFERTMATGESVACPLEVVGYDPKDEEISRWTFTWSFRAKL